ncbi:MAG TPA: ABC transporter ATP-binding protein [Candidatus Limnocylindrales bacterium]|nr:ABC transporter ATP-binding protein [Candidatus Limnocylindrales bacterium]
MPGSSEARAGSAIAPATPLAEPVVAAPDAGRPATDGRAAAARRAEPSPEAADLAILVRDLGIRYNLRLTKRTTLKGSLAGIFRRNLVEVPTHFWALRHLDLELGHGESLAVIGPNGAGKTTLLLALAGILDPSEGEIHINGRISTLLTLGAGFDPELTGRENIDLSAAFLGIDHHEMAELTPGIIEFADIGAFIDAPVRTYSTGMRARLGFSIATAVTPDILLLDEVLGTGDQSFRTRSQQRIRELLGGANSIVVVTHDLPFVTENCSRAILLERGTLIHSGAPEETVEVYRQRIQENKLLAESDAKRFARRA